MAEIKKIKIGATEYTITDSNAIHGVKSINTNNTASLGTNASESISGSGTINLHKVSKTGNFSDLNGRGEEYLEWGGPSKTGSVSPIGMALSAEHSANRVALINPNALTFEYSSDGGTTWTEYPYTGTTKTQFCTSSLTLNIGRPDGSTGLVANKSKTRITITAQNGTNTYVYTSLKKMLINVSTATTLSLLIEIRTGNSYKNNGAWVEVGKYNLSGWSGWNDIPTLFSLGGSRTQTGNNWQMRLTITCTTVSSPYPKQGAVLGIRLFGDNCWSPASTLAETGNIYTFDMSGNVTFPGKLFAKAGSSTSYSVLLGGVTNAFKGSSAFNSGKIYLGQGDNNALDIGNDGRINTGNNTLLGMMSGALTIGHASYNTNIRGRATRPAYNGGELALKSDIETYSIATSTTAGLVKIGYADEITNKNYAVKLNDNGQMFVHVPWMNTVYSLPTASSSVKGGVKVGTGLKIASDVLSVDTATIATKESVNSLVERVFSGLNKKVETIKTEYSGGTSTDPTESYRTQILNEGKDLTLDCAYVPVNNSHYNFDQPKNYSYIHVDNNNVFLASETDGVGTALSLNSIGLYMSYDRDVYKVLDESVVTSDVTSGSTDVLTSGGAYTALSKKQDKLVSGTNIKTINGSSIVGSGNISVSASLPSNVVETLDNTSGHFEYGSTDWVYGDYQQLVMQSRFRYT